MIEDIIQKEIIPKLNDKKNIILENLKNQINILTSNKKNKLC